MSCVRKQCKNEIEKISLDFCESASKMPKNALMLPIKYHVLQKISILKYEIDLVMTKNYQSHSDCRVQNDITWGFFLCCSKEKYLTFIPKK